jgi:Na+/melibiose symporter-like transporter
MKARAPGRSKRRSKVEPEAVAASPTAAAETDVNRTARSILFVVFALSGLTGLVYEATWTRYLQLFLGHAAYAQVLVLSIFMGGMALGALLAPRLGRGAVAPLVAYAAIEALLGLAALAFHPIFDAVTSFVYAKLLPASEGSAAVFALQWLLGAALILPQSILLGMTFPMMSASVLRLGSERGGRVFAMLYFTNSAGACSRCCTSRTARAR